MGVPVSLFPLPSSLDYEEGSSQAFFLADKKKKKKNRTKSSANPEKVSTIVEAKQFSH